MEKNDKFSNDYFNEDDKGFEDDVFTKKEEDSLLNSKKSPFEDELEKDLSLEKRNRFDNPSSDEMNQDLKKNDIDGYIDLEKQNEEILEEVEKEKANKKKLEEKQLKEKERAKRVLEEKKNEIQIEYETKRDLLQQQYEGVTNPVALEQMVQAEKELNKQYYNDINYAIHEFDNEILKIEQSFEDSYRSISNENKGYTNNDSVPSYGEPYSMANDTTDENLNSLYQTVDNEQEVSQETSFYVDEGLNDFSNSYQSNDAPSQEYMESLYRSQANYDSQFCEFSHFTMDGVQTDYYAFGQRVSEEESHRIYEEGKKHYESDSYKTDHGPIEDPSQISSVVDNNQGSSITNDTSNANKDADSYSHTNSNDSGGSNGSPGSSGGPGGPGSSGGPDGPGGDTTTGNTYRNVTSDEKPKEKDQAVDAKTGKSILHFSDVRNQFEKYANVEGVGSVVQTMKDEVVHTMAREQSGTVSSMRSTIRNSQDVFATAMFITNIGNEVQKATRMASRAGNAVANTGRYLTGVDLKNPKSMDKVLNTRDAVRQGVFGKNANGGNINPGFSSRKVDNQISKLNKEIRELEKFQKKMEKTKGIGETGKKFKLSREQIVSPGSRIGAESLKNLKKHKVNKTTLELAKKRNRLKRLKEGRDVQTRDRGNRDFRRAVWRQFQKQLNKSDEAGFNGVLSGVNFITNRYTRYSLKMTKKAAWKSGKMLGKVGLRTAKKAGKTLLRASGHEIYYNAQKSALKARLAPKKKKLRALKNRVKGELNGGMYRRLSRKISRKTPNSIKEKGRIVKRLIGKGGNILSSPFRWGKKTILKITNSKWFKPIKWIYRMPGGVLRSISQAAQKMKIFLLKLAGYVVVFFLISAIVTQLLGAIGGLVSSVILGDGEDKVNLSPFVAVLKEKDSAFHEQLENAVAKYDDVVYPNGTNTDNFKEIISMAAVRFKNDLGKDKKYNSASTYANPVYEKREKVYDYMRELYDISHSYTITEEKYKDDCGAQKYFCTEEGHEIYNKNGCETKIISKKEMNIKDPKKGDKEAYGGHLYTYDGKQWVAHYCPGEHKECPGHTRANVIVRATKFPALFSIDRQGNLVLQNAQAGDKIGTFVITAYCNCAECCGKHSPERGGEGKTASGTYPIEGRTIAVDPDVIPLGTHVVINGHEYIAEDTGSAIKGKKIDMFFETHDAALYGWGKQELDVYYVGESSSENVAELVTNENKWHGWNDDNKEWCMNIYEQNWNELYDGWTGGSGSVDMSIIDIDWSKIELHDGTLTDAQKKLVAVASNSGSYGIAVTPGYCQAWVADVVLATTGGTRYSAESANDAGDLWRVSTDWSKIKVGATVYGAAKTHGGTLGQLYGHVGIYIGNGKVISNEGSIKVRTLEEWVRFWEGTGWGWNGGIDLSK